VNRKSLPNKSPTWPHTPPSFISFGNRANLTNYWPMSV
jgi:hypothetical protein